MDHTELKCITGLIIKYKKSYKKQFELLSAKFSKIQEKIKKKNKFMELKCAECHRHSCEIALKNCFLCKLQLCTYCAKQNFNSCSKCHEVFCQSCFNFSIKNKTYFCCNDKLEKSLN